MKLHMTKLEHARWTYINSPSEEGNEPECHVLMRRPCLAVSINTTNPKEFDGNAWAQRTVDSIYVSVIGTDKNVLVHFCNTVQEMIENRINSEESLSLDTVPLPDSVKELLVSPPSTWKYYLKHPESARNSV